MRHQRSVVLPSAPTAVRRARQLLRAALEDAGRHGGASAALAELLVSEVATNAVRYGGGSPFEVAVDVGPDEVRVVVRDASTEVPRPRRAGPLEEGGRGVHLLGMLATAWGWDVGRGGKSVWFALALTCAGDRPSPGCGGVDHVEGQAPQDLAVDRQDQGVRADAGHGGDQGDGEADGHPPALEPCG